MAVRQNITGLGIPVNSEVIRQQVGEVLGEVYLINVSKSLFLMSNYWLSGGEDGIRTHETLLEPTPLAGERLRPLGHLSAGGDIPLFEDLSTTQTASAVLGLTRRTETPARYISISASSTELSRR